MGRAVPHSVVVSHEGKVIETVRFPSKAQAMEWAGYQAWDGNLVEVVNAYSGVVVKRLK